MLNDGKNGLMFECGNYEQLAKNLELLIRDRKLRISISNSGNTLAEDFSWENVALKTKMVYESLLNKGE